MQASELEANVVVYNSVLDACARAGDPKLAKQLLKVMGESGQDCLLERWMRSMTTVQCGIPNTYPTYMRLLRFWFHDHRGSVQRAPIIERLTARHKPEGEAEAAREGDASHCCVVTNTVYCHTIAACPLGCVAWFGFHILLLAAKIHTLRRPVHF